MASQFFLAPVQRLRPRNSRAIHNPTHSIEVACFRVHLRVRSHSVMPSLCRETMCIPPYLSPGLACSPKSSSSITRPRNKRLRHDDPICYRLLSVLLTLRSDWLVKTCFVCISSLSGGYVNSFFVAPHSLLFHPIILSSKFRGALDAQGLTP